MSHRERSLKISPEFFFQYNIVTFNNYKANFSFWAGESLLGDSTWQGKAHRFQVPAKNHPILKYWDTLWSTKSRHLLCHTGDTARSINSSKGILLLLAIGRAKRYVAKKPPSPQTSCRCWYRDACNGNKDLTLHAGDKLFMERNLHTICTMPLRHVGLQAPVAKHTPVASWLLLPYRHSCELCGRQLLLPFRATSSCVDGCRANTSALPQSK